MLTWIATFAGAKAAGFLRAHLFQIILVLAVAVMGALIWGHYNGLKSENEANKKALIEKRLELERAVEANKNNQGVIKDLVEANKLNSRTTGGVREDLQKQAKLLAEMKVELLKMQGQAAPLTPPLKLGVTRMNQLLDQAQQDIKQLQAPAPLAPTDKSAPTAEDKLKKPAVKKSLTDLKPQGDAK